MHDLYVAFVKSVDAWAIWMLIEPEEKCHMLWKYCRYVNTKSPERAALQKGNWKGNGANTLPDIHYTGQLIPDQQVYKQVTIPPVKITDTCNESKCALHLMFIPRRCHSFCSFNGFRQLGWNCGNAVFVCVTETHWGICCKRVNTGVRFTVGHRFKLMFFFFF